MMKKRIYKVKIFGGYGYRLADTETPHYLPPPECASPARAGTDGGWRIDWSGGQIYYFFV